MRAKLIKLFKHIDKLLENANVSQFGTGKNPTTTLYSATAKNEIFFVETKTIKKAKIIKRAHAFKNYAHTYNGKILNYFSPELQLENTKSVIKSKLNNSSNELRRLKF